MQMRSLDARVAELEKAQIATEWAEFIFAFRDAAAEIFALMQGKALGEPDDEEDSRLWAEIDPGVRDTLARWYEDWKVHPELFPPQLTRESEVARMRAMILQRWGLQPMKTLPDAGKTFIVSRGAA